MLHGSCHCGALKLELDTLLEPAELPVRLCGCSFCARHRPRFTSDPSGRVTIRFASEAQVIRYRFGLRLADFLICAACGVFVAALEPDSPARAAINLAVLDRAEEFTSVATTFTAYDTEDVATRRARRVKAWTPAAVELRS